MADHDDDSEHAARPTKGAAPQSSPIIRLLESETTPQDYALAERLGKFGGDHKLLAARLVRALETAEKTSGEELADQMMQAHAKHEEVLRTVQGDIKDLKRDMGLARWIVRGAATSAIGALIYVASKIWSRAEVETESRIRFEYLQQQANRHEAEIERLRTQPRKDPP